MPHIPGDADHDPPRRTVARLSETLPDWVFTRPEVLRKPPADDGHQLTAVSIVIVERASTDNGNAQDVEIASADPLIVHVRVGRDRFRILSFDDNCLSIGLTELRERKIRIARRASPAGQVLQAGENVALKLARLRRLVVVR